MVESARLKCVAVTSKKAGFSAAEPACLGSFYRPRERAKRKRGSEEREARGQLAGPDLAAHRETREPAPLFSGLFSAAGDWHRIATDYSWWLSLKSAVMRCFCWSAFHPVFLRYSEFFSEAGWLGAQSVSGFESSDELGFSTKRSNSRRGTICTSQDR